MSLQTASTPAPKSANAISAGDIANGIRPIAVDMLEGSPLNPRKHFDEEGLKTFAVQIASQGVLQNLVARPHPKKAGRFEIIAGERRWRAAKLAKIATVPVFVRQATDQEVLEVATAENIGRETLTPMEEADALVQLVKVRADTGMEKVKAIKEVAELVGKTYRFVEQRMALVQKLHPDAQKAVRAGTLNVTQARLLTQAPHDKQTAVLKEIIPTKGGHHRRLETESEIAAAVRATLVPVDAAWFDPKLYTGKLEPHPDDKDVMCFMDTGQFERLQKEFIDNQVADLKKKWPWVDVQTHYNIDGIPYGFERAKGDNPKAGALIILDQPNREERRYKVHTGIIQPGNPARGGTAPKKAGESTGRSEPAFDTWGFNFHCRGLKTHALQAAVLADSALALRLVCFELLTNQGALGLTKHLHQVFEIDDSGDTVKDVTAQLRKLAAKSIGKTPAQTWDLLMKLGASELSHLLTVLVANRAEVEHEPGKPNGDHPAAVHIARSLKLSVKEVWSFGTGAEKFLKICGDKQLRRVGAELGLAFSGATTLPQMRKAISAVVAKNKDYLPPWMQFFTNEELNKHLATKVTRAELKSAMDKVDAKKALAALKKNTSGKGIKPKAAKKAPAKKKR